MVAIQRREDGFTYLGMIVFVAVLGLVGAATLKVESLLARAAAEEELLEVGAAFSAALESYAAATPPGQPTAPPNLQALLKDPRFPSIRRHLRKIYIDPITGKADWGVTYLGDKVGVIAIYSLSEAAPLKVANFDSRFLNFENKTHFSEWKFMPNGQNLQSGGGEMTGKPMPATPLFPAAASGEAKPGEPKPGDAKPGQLPPAQPAPFRPQLQPQVPPTTPAQPAEPPAQSQPDIPAPAPAEPVEPPEQEEPEPPPPPRR